MTEFLLSTKLVGVLFILIVLNIVSGTVASVMIEGEPFDKQFFVTGVVKAFVACIAMIALAYVFGVVDLTPLGFEPKTAISSGIAVYAAKLLKNVSKLIGININNKANVLSSFLSPINIISPKEEAEKKEEPAPVVEEEENTEEVVEEEPKEESKDTSAEAEAVG